MHHAVIFNCVPFFVPWDIIMSLVYYLLTLCRTHGSVLDPILNRVTRRWSRSTGDECSSMCERGKKNKQTLISSLFSAPGQDHRLFPRCALSEPTGTLKLSCRSDEYRWRKFSELCFCREKTSAVFHTQKTKTDGRE